MRRANVEGLNGLLLDLAFKFPDLWDEEFLDSLAVNNIDRAAALARSAAAVSRPGPTSQGRATTLMDLKDRFFALCANENRQEAGLALERLLNELFEHFALQPRASFRLVGEQIDGSFVLDFETYLAEAKWTLKSVDAADLFIFREKVEGKSASTRGLFLSVNGFAPNGLDALIRGKQPLFFLMDGVDLCTVLQDQIELPALLSLKQRRLAEEGSVFVPARELLVGNGG